MSAVARLLQDIVRVLQEYRVPLRSHALHAYHSAFVTMPQCLLLETLQKESLPSSLPSLTSARTPSWGSWNRVMEGHTDEVRCVAVSSSGQHVVSGSKDGTVRVWNAVTLKELAKLKPDDKGYVASISFSPDGARFVTISVAGAVHVFDFLTLRQLVELEINRELISLHTWLSDDPRTFCSVFSNDGTRLIAAAAGEVCIWSAVTFEELGRFKAHAPIALSPHGTRIVAFRSRKITEAAVYDATTFEELAQLQTFTTDVQTIAFSPDDHHVVFGMSNNSLRVWDAVTWKEIAILKSPAYIGGVSSVAFSPCGSRIVSASADQTLRLWDVTSHNELSQFKGHEGTVRAVAFSPDGKQIVSGSGDNTVRIWSATTFEDSLSVEDNRARRNRPIDVAFLADGTRLMTLCTDGLARICDADSLDGLGELEHSPRADDGHSIIVWSSDGSLITTRYSPHNSLRVWSTTTFEMAAEIQLGLHAGASFECAAFSPDNMRIVSGMRDGTVLVWSILSSEVLAELTFNESGSRVKCVAYSPCGSHIAAGSGLTLKWWSAITYEELYVYHYSKLTTSLDFSHDGARLVVSFSAREFKQTDCIVWNVETFQLLAQFEADFYRRPVFTADGRGILFYEADAKTSACMPNEADNAMCEFPNGAVLPSLTPFQQLCGQRFRSQR
jgi:WD40 repeat protein